MSTRLNAISQPVFWAKLVSSMELRSRNKRSEPSFFLTELNRSSTLHFMGLKTANAGETGYSGYHSEPNVYYLTIYFLDNVGEGSCQEEIQPVLARAGCEQFATQF